MSRILRPWRKHLLTFNSSDSINSKGVQEDKKVNLVKPEDEVKLPKKEILCKICQKTHPKFKCGYRCMHCSREDIGTNLSDQDQSSMGSVRSEKGVKQGIAPLTDNKRKRDFFVSNTIYLDTPIVNIDQDFVDPSPICYDIHRKLVSERESDDERLAAQHKSGDEKLVDGGKSGEIVSES